MMLEVEKFSVENTEVLEGSYPHECREFLFFFKSGKVSLSQHLVSVKTKKKAHNPVVANRYPCTDGMKKTDFTSLP